MNTLKNILKQRDITISSFAKDISASSQQVCNWFNRGKIPKDFIIPIAKALNITLEEAINLKASSENISSIQDEKQLPMKEER